MNEHKTRKVLTINENGLHLECIKHYDEATPYRLYKVWWNGGWHRKEVIRLRSFNSVLTFVSSHQWND